VNVRLVVVEGPETGRSFSFDAADSFLVGRSPRAHLVLDPRADRYISRTHCLIDIRPPRCIVNDLGSTNGTFVNEQRIERREVVDGDEIRVGHTRIRVMISDAGPAVEPAREEATGPAPPAAGSETQPVFRPAVDERTWSPPIAGQSWDPQLEAMVPTQLLKSPAYSAPQAAQPRLRCLECSTDIAEADADGLAAELTDALYICPDCEISLTRRTTGASTLGDYTIIGELGRGGMGIVLKAISHRTRRICAIKEVLPEVAKDERTFRLFEREIGIQSKVLHPNLVRLLDHGREQDTCYFVSEYLAGGDAGHLVRSVRKGPIELGLAISTILDALAGLEALHRNGYVHRDLKPANILFSKEQAEGFGTAKITDYGLAKSFEEAGNSLFDFTREGEAAGSLLFMPPEQILNYRFVQPPTDVYAAGVSLYFMLTGQYTVRYPALAGVPAETGTQARNPIEALIEDPPIPIHDRAPTIPESIARVVDKAVQKELSQRYQTATELRNDLLSAAMQERLV
jgi:serine/threonine-protein kinase